VVAVVAVELMETQYVVRLEETAALKQDPLISLG
jgi:hypothetical protein